MKKKNLKEVSPAWSIVAVRTIIAGSATTAAAAAEAIGGGAVADEV